MSSTSQRQPRTARPSGGYIDDLTVAAGRAGAERRSGSVQRGRRRVLQGLACGIHIGQPLSLHRGRTPLHPHGGLVGVLRIPGRYPLMLGCGALGLDPDVMRC